MGNIHNNKYKEKDQLLPVKYKEIVVGNEELLNSNNIKMQMLVGDKPIVFLKPDKEEIPIGIDEYEFNNILADAYLYGII
jgi:hypothetical protein